jgi:hypothetical protein
MSGSVDRTNRSNFSGIRVRIIGVSNDTVTMESARETVTPSISEDSPAGTIGATGALSATVLAPESATTGVAAGEDIAAVETATGTADESRRAALLPRIAVAPIALAPRQVAIVIAAALPRSIKRFRLMRAAVRAS